MPSQLASPSSGSTHVPGGRLEVAAVEVGVGDSPARRRTPAGAAATRVRRAHVEVVEGQDRDPHRRNSTTWRKARRGLGDEGQQAVDVDQVRAPRSQVRSQPASRGPAGQQAAAGGQQVAGAVEHQRARQPGEVASAGGDLRAAEVVGRAGPPARRTRGACRGTATVSIASANRRLRGRSWSGRPTGRAAPGASRGCAAVAHRLARPRAPGRRRRSRRRARSRPARRPSARRRRRARRGSRATCARARAGSRASRPARRARRPGGWRSGRGRRRSPAMKPPPCR